MLAPVLDIASVGMPVKHRGPAPHKARVFRQNIANPQPVPPVTYRHADLFSPVIFGYRDFARINRQLARYQPFQPIPTTGGQAAY